MSKKHEKLSGEIIDTINKALSAYLGDDILVHDNSYDKDEEWKFSVTSEWLSRNRGIFEHVVSKYRIDADVIRHSFEDKDSYRNGNVYRIYPHISWVHFNGGTNGHATEPELIVIEKHSIGEKWSIGLTLR